jgi:hypothetical protein
MLMSSGALNDTTSRIHLPRSPLHHDRNDSIPAHLLTSFTSNCLNPLLPLFDFDFSIFASIPLFDLTHISFGDARFVTLHFTSIELVPTQVSSIHRTSFLHTLSLQSRCTYILILISIFKSTLYPNSTLTWHDRTGVSRKIQYDTHDTYDPLHMFAYAGFDVFSVGHYSVFGTRGTRGQRGTYIRHMMIYTFTCYLSYLCICVHCSNRACGL